MSTQPSSTLRHLANVCIYALWLLLLQLKTPYIFLTGMVISTPDSITGLYINTLLDFNALLMSSKYSFLVKALSKPIERFPLDQESVSSNPPLCLKLALNSDLYSIL